MHICVLINYMNRNRAFSSHDNDSFHISVCDGYCLFSLNCKCFVSVMFCNIVNGLFGRCFSSISAHRTSCKLSIFDKQLLQIDTDCSWFFLRIKPNRTARLSSNLCADLPEKNIYSI